MSRASKNVYHPHGDADTYKTVEETLDDLDTRATQNASDITDLQAALAAAEADIDAQIATINTTLATKAVKTQNWEQSWTIEYPQNQAYRLVINAKVPRTVTSITTRCASGSCVVTSNVNGTNLSPTNSASTTEQERTYSPGTALPAGGDLLFTVSANSSCHLLTITAAGTLTLA